MPLVSFSPGQVISSTNVNANFALCVLTDTSRTVTVTHTYTASQTFTGGWTAAAACTISSGGIAVTGNSTITGTLTALTGLTTSGTASLAAVSVSGLISATAANPLAMSGQTTGLQFISFANTGATIVFGVDRSVGGGLVSGSTAYAAVLTTSGSDLYFGTNSAARLGINSTGSVLFTAAASRIVPGATSLSHRNNADSADNLLITDAGIAAFRGAVTTGAVAGAPVLANAIAFSGNNAAGSGTVKAIRINSLDRVEIAPDGGEIAIGRALIAMAGGAAPTLGTIGGGGPTATAQNKWAKFFDSTGAAFWVPTWI